MGRQLHLISDGSFSKDHLQILKYIYKYIDYFHIREKTKTAREVLEIIEMLEAADLPLDKVIINDRADIAVIKECAGVQLGHHSPLAADVRNVFPKLKIGQSIHSPAEAGNAEGNDVDFLLYGHIYASRSKPDQTPKGLAELQTVASYTSIPVYAIGGITPELTAQTVQAGAAGIAVMSGIWQAKDPVETVRAYRAVLDTQEGGRNE